MREIKFRAWDGEHLLKDFLVAGAEFCNAIGVLQDEEFAKKNYCVKEWKLMQYTGLKDKNGKEIYEGDICTVFTIRPTPIIFHNGAFGYFSADYIMPNFISFAGNSNFAWMDGKSDDIEIIGNIYEHPHLLK